MENKNYKVKKLIKIMLNKYKFENIFKFLKKKLNNEEIIIFEKKSEFIDFIYKNYENKIILSQSKIKSIKKYLKLHYIEINHRKILWKLLTNCHYNMHYKKDYYSNLSKLFNTEIFYLKKVIDVDILRTNYNDHNEEERIIMKRILFNFCKRNIIIGYLQGMNFIVEYFWNMGFQEEEIFWIIVFIYENKFPNNYFSNMKVPLFDIKILNYMIYYKIPKIYKFLVNNDYDLMFFTFNNFITWFLDSGNKKLKKIIIENIIFDGNLIIFKVILSILKNNSANILKCNDLIKLTNYYNQIIKDLIFEKDIQVYEYIENIYINKTLLKVLKNKFLLFNNEESKSDKETKPIWLNCCDNKFSFCDLNEKLNNNDNQDELIFKCDNINNYIIDSYLFNKNKNLKPSNEVLKEEILIIRDKHSCQLKEVFDSKLKMDFYNREIYIKNKNIIYNNSNQQKLLLSAKKIYSNFINRKTKKVNEKEIIIKPENDFNINKNDLDLNILKKKFEKVKFETIIFPEKLN